MPVTLAQAQVNTQDDVDYAVIDNFRRYSWLLDQLVFDDTVTPGTGGGSLVYGYTRLITPRSASFRAFNSEYTREKAVRERKTVELHPVGGTFGIDRALAALGASATNEESFQMQQVVTSTRIRFIEELINGDLGADPDGFDGLDAILAGTDTEHTAAAGATHIGAAAIDTQAKAMAALDEIDEWLAEIVPSTVGGGDLGEPGALPPGVKALVGNTRMITRVRALARWAGLHTADKDDVGRAVERYGDWVLIDAGNVSNGSAPIIPTTTGASDLYAATFGLDSVHGASVAGLPLVQTWMPDYDTAGAVKDGEVEMGPCALVVKNTKAAGVLRGVDITNAPT